jgi:spore coat polysaccharide biosynthesis predicted glycosyltransferase SpsG
MQRRRLVFRVIGNDRVGMGHIFRALTLAHELIDHEVIFFSDRASAKAVKELVGKSYPVETFDLAGIVKSILNIKPDVVINDILDTEVKDVEPLTEQGVKVLNFEDLGEGAQFADLVINELYDQPKIKGDNILWGRNHFFVRDEFSDANQNQSVEKVDNLLLAFGGVDQHDLSKKIYHAIRSLCKEKGVRIFIVTGPGYSGYETLRSEVEGNPDVDLTHSTGVISQIMEKVQLAITSNGRTVYELAHMSIPAIVIPQHEREKTHAFACKENGFVQLAPYAEGETEIAVGQILNELLEDKAYRQALFNATNAFRFDKNKKTVVSRILHLFDS